MIWIDSKLVEPPKNGKPFWGHLSDTGIHKMRFMSSAEACEIEGGDNPDDYEEGYVQVAKEWDAYWTPKFWAPLDALPDPQP